MKTILFTLAMAMIAFASFGATKSYAHCGTCETSVNKPCEKCVKAGKPCKCGKKAQKPCEKTLGEKKPCAKCAEKKPCKICEQSEKKFHHSKSMMDHSDKGSLTIRSGSPEADRYN